MKSVLYLVSALSFLLAYSANTFAYTGRSIRIMGLGDELTGVMRDEYTDIYRNPAYLSLVSQARIFGRHNLVDQTELRIAPQLTNKGTALLGLAVPVSGSVNLAAMGEYKPSTSKSNPPSRTSRTDHTDYYSISWNSEKVSSQQTILNLKTIGSLKLSDSWHIGLDFVALENYNRQDSHNSSTIIQRRIPSDELLYHRRNEDIRNSDDSPDAFKLSVGLLSTSGRHNTFDCAFYYERMSYGQTSSLKAESQTDRYWPDTTSSGRFSWSGSEGAPEDNALGLDVNLRRRISKNTSLAFLLGIRHERSTFSREQQTADTTISSPDYVRSATNNASIDRDDNGLGLMLGFGGEKTFAFKPMDVFIEDVEGFCRVGVAVKGYWDQGELDRYESSRDLIIVSAGDSLVGSSDHFEENKVRQTIDSYRLTTPMAIEIVLENTITARLGGGLVWRRTETENGYSTSLKAYYSRGFGVTLDERIFFDAYIKDSLNRMSSWMVGLEYRF
jgi:hypothetical protein